MTNIGTVRPLSTPRTVSRGAANFSAALLFAPVPLGLVVGLFSLMIGVDPVYVAFQLLLFILLVPLVYLLRSDEKYTPSILLATFLKLFFVSQIISVLVWHRADASLLEATRTELALAVGLVAGMLGMVVARLIHAAAPGVKPLLAWNPNPDRLHQLGLLSGAVGLVAQICWTYFVTHSALSDSGTATQSNGAPIFEFLSPLAVLSICSFGAEQLIRTERRTFLSPYSLIVLAIYFMAILPLATKTEPLRPLIALVALAALYRWKIRPVPIIAGALLLLLVVDFFYPAITLARMTAYGEQKPTFMVFGEVAVKSITDPAEFQYVRDYSDSYDTGTRQNYYGRALGFWDRFTPQVTDQLISGAQYVQPVGPKIFGEALYAVMPQSLGFRKTTDAQMRIESAMSRTSHIDGKVTWANSGYVGDGYLSGGLPMVACLFFVFTLAISLATRFIFVNKARDFLWIPLFVCTMFSPADGGFVTSVYPFFWMWAIYSAATFVLIRYLARRDPGIIR